MLDTLDIGRQDQPLLSASETRFIDLRNPSGKAVLPSGGTLIGGDISFDVPDHIEFVAGIRFFTSFDIHSTFPQQPLNQVELAQFTVTLKSWDSEVLVNRTPIALFANRSAMTNDAWGVNTYFAPKLIDPRQSFVTCYAKGILHTLWYQFLYY